jgi:uncharacterized protein YecE (DUF72 family)
MAADAKIRIGISGWVYPPWRGTFYPGDLTQKKEMEYASRHFNSIELNGSFYSLQRPQSFQSWFDATPEDFQFSVKGPRFITHIRSLREVESPLANFFAQGILKLGAKLGPILWQLPPNSRFEADVMERFLQLLPHSHLEAASVAERHDDWMRARAWFKVTEDRKLEHAVEIRNRSFVSEEFIALLRKYDVALVVADTPDWPRLMDVTADFMYCRLHGSEKLYASGYDADALSVWARRVVAWSRGEEVADGDKASAQPGHKRASRDVFVYFDNDMKVRAPYDAASLQAEVSRLLLESA